MFDAGRGLGGQYFQRMEGVTGKKSPSLLRDLILVMTFCSLSVSQRGKREEEGKKPTHTTTSLQLSQEEKRLPASTCHVRSRLYGQNFKIQAKKLQLTLVLLNYHPQSQHLHMLPRSCFLKLKTKACH